MTTTVKGYAASKQGGDLETFEYDLEGIGPGEVDVDVEFCGICHSDLSMIDNEWGMSAYPLVAGHEVAGRVRQVGEGVTHVKAGDRVGVGWFSSSCMSCRQCLKGRQNLCAQGQGTIVGRHGGFADRVRCDAVWAIPIPEGVSLEKAGPLFCGGATVFTPIAEFGLRPTDRVGVIGIGGLGHMALMFLNEWGCEVTAFTSSESKMEEAKRLGAHRCVNSRDAEAIKKEAGRFDLIISTVNVSLEWSAYLQALAPQGRFHNVGAVLDPMPISAFDLMFGQKQMSGSPVGSIGATMDMLDFCARHGIEPVTERFPMSKVNDALQHLRDGKARYRVVLEAGK